MQRVDCTGSGLMFRMNYIRMNEYIREVQSRLNVIAEEREFVAPEHGPLKRLNKRAIEIADSHGAATARSGTGSTSEGALAEHGRKSRLVMVDGNDLMSDRWKKSTGTSTGDFVGSVSAHGRSAFSVMTFLVGSKATAETKGVFDCRSGSSNDGSKFRGTM